MPAKKKKTVKVKSFRKDVKPGRGKKMKTIKAHKRAKPKK